MSTGAGVAQSVKCLTTDRTTTGVRSSVYAKGYFSFIPCPDRLWGPHSLFNGNRESLPGGKARPGRDADHSPHLVPRSGKSKSYNASPLGACMAVALQPYFIIGVHNFGSSNMQHLNNHT
jgi:hypothetical protein